MKRIAAKVALSFVAALATQASANPDSLVLTPPMGWNSWNVFHENINEKQIREIADAMVSSGLRDAGYIYLNLDDNWMHTKRDANGDLQNHPTTFPSGMKALADYIHDKGLKFGVYGDRGKRTCHHYNSHWDSENGSYMHEEQDAKKFAEWGVDYLKYDNCDPAPDSNQEEDYRRMSKALRNSGRDIVFSICAWGYQKWMPEISHLWRSTFDIGPEWVSTSWYRGLYDIIDANDEYWQVAKPGHWNDPDMLEVDNGITYEESRSQMTMWSIMAAPIMISSDIRKMSTEIKELYLNSEMIAVNQDSLGVQGHRISKKDGREVWMKPLRNGDIAVALLNSGNNIATVECDFKDLGVDGEVEVRDIWKKKDLGKLTHVSAELPGHGSAMLRLVVTPVPRELFKGAPLAIPGKIEMEDFDINGIGAGNTTYNDMDVENHSCTGNDKSECSEYRKETGVDIYKKSDGRIVVGYNQVGDWLEYTVDVAESGEYTLSASVASGCATSSFKFAIDGVDITEEISVPKGAGENNYNDYNEVSVTVNLEKGEHILRFIVTGDWMDIDYVKFESNSAASDDPSGVQPAPDTSKTPAPGTSDTTVADTSLAIVKALNAQFLGSHDLDVFAVTGKHLGRVHVENASSLKAISESMKMAGFAKGVYMVRDMKSSRMTKLQIK